MDEKNALEERREVVAMSRDSLGVTPLYDDIGRVGEWRRMEGTVVLDGKRYALTDASDLLDYQIGYRSGYHDGYADAKDEVAEFVENMSSTIGE